MKRFVFSYIHLIIALSRLDINHCDYNFISQYYNWNQLSSTLYWKQDNITDYQKISNCFLELISKKWQYKKYGLKDFNGAIKS